MQKTLTPLSKVMAKPMDRLDRDLDEHGLYVMRRVADLKISYIDHEDLYGRRVESLLFAEKIDATEVSDSWNKIFDYSNINQPVANKKYILTKAEEKILFLQFNYARMRVYRVIERAHTRRLSPKEAAEVVKYQDIADDTRNALFMFNLPLVHSIGGKMGFASWADYPVLLNGGEDGLMNCICQFNVSYGFKFSTYTFPAIKRGYCRVAAKLIKKYNVEAPFNLDDWQHPQHYDDTVTPFDLEHMWEVIRSGEVLDDKERNILLQRYLNGDILDEIGSYENISKERVRQIIKLALRKLRKKIVA